MSPFINSDTNMMYKKEDEDNIVNVLTGLNERIRIIRRGKKRKQISSGLFKLEYLTLPI